MSFSRNRFTLLRDMLSPKSSRIIGFIANAGDNMRVFAFALSLIGLLVFGGGFVASLVSPISVERFARAAIKSEVEKRVDESIERLDDTRIGKLAERVLNRNEEQAAAVRKAIAEGVPQRIAKITADMLDADCTCRQKINAATGGLFDSSLSALERVNKQVTDLIRSKYQEVAGLLVNEFRIFTGSNALVFAALGLVTLLKPRANLHLILPIIVLIGGAALTGYFYIFQQNWLHTIVFSDYVGWLYFPWLGVSIGWLADLLLNKGRVTVEILGNLPTAILDSVGSIGPC